MKSENLYLFNFESDKQNSKPVFENLITTKRTIMSFRRMKSFFFYFLFNIVPTATRLQIHPVMKIGFIFHECAQERGGTKGYIVDYVEHA